MKVVVSSILGCSLFMMACDIKTKKDDEISNEELVSIENLWFDNEMADSSPIPLEKIQSGDYQISEIITAYEDRSETKFRSVFLHKTQTAGDLAKGDLVKRAVDFSQVDLEEYSLYPFVEINLPKAIRSENEKVDFFNKYYYWNQNKSDGSWQWSISGGLSPKGDQFHKDFASAEYKNGGYVIEDGNDKRTLIVTQRDSLLTITVEEVLKDETTRYRLTYLKTGLNTVHNENEVKSTNENGGEVVSKVMFEELDSRSVLPYVGIYTTDLMSGIDYLAFTPSRQIIGLVDEDDILKVKYSGLQGSDKLQIVKYDDGSLAGFMEGRTFELEKMNAGNAPHENAKLTLELFRSAKDLQEVVAEDGFSIEFDFKSANYDTDLSKPFHGNQLRIMKELSDNWNTLRPKVNENVGKFEDWAHDVDPDTSDLTATKLIVVSDMEADNKGDVHWTHVSTLDSTSTLKYEIRIPSNDDITIDEFNTYLEEGLETSYSIN